ncbi:MAG: MAPEG family protein [Alphaproteobacteria bacterium]|jgi:uncharacterized MAPEG superfamily protein|nr:MAPEG family protein [Alphaproteobacteria bacterium]MBU0805327.1 MAPEG family protein [Alphaproteobacteria bacterium]MBU0873273.1 MAPEG family protein [Alphaproteobacteria bacterium]MBU1401499.1 MAPEG family protein [Alphaproteobacteria bacterium]MBU1592084.1 MAPEG family protein [Alphaproteobacteria bacterium]
MEAVAASTEISVLAWSVVLLLAQIVLQASVLGDLTPGYLFSPRDEERKTNSVLAERLKRALHNLLETYPAFIALVVGLVATGKTGGMAATGALLWIICRVIYVVLYAAGVPVARTLIWLGSIIGLVMMLIQLIW